jgi:cytochrome c556
MKAALVCFILASALALAGCADELEQQTPQDVQQHFKRGLRGEGKLGPVDRSNDPFEHPNQPSSPDFRPNSPPQP